MLAGERGLHFRMAGKQGVEFVFREHFFWSRANSGLLGGYGNG